MNISCKHLSLSITLSLLCATAHTHCMRVKKLAETSIFYSLRQKSTTTKIQFDDSTNIDTSSISTPQKKIIFGPLKDFVPSTELRLLGKKAEPWSGEKVEEMSVNEFLYGLKELEKIHKAYLEIEDAEHTPASKQLDIDSYSENIPLHRASDGDFDDPKHTSAWKELGLLICEDIPIARPDDGKPSDPKYTLRPGEEIKLTKAMCELMRGNREAGLTPFEDDQHQYKTNDEKTNISPSHCTSKALMCIANPEQSQKKKRRLLKDELKYPDGEPMGGDTLAYSFTAEEFLAMLPELEQQHRDNVDRCDRE